MLDLSRLVILRAVSIHGSMTAAARELSYSHSAISQQLAVLEREAGVALLERVGRSVQLTSAGRELVRNTDAILTAVETAETDLARSQREARGVMTIATFATLGRTVVPEALRRLADDFPRLSVRVELHTPEEAVVLLTLRQVDAVLTDSYPGTEVAAATGIHSTVLGEDPIRAYLPVGCPDRDLKTLRHVPWVMEPSDTASARWARRVCREQGFEPMVAHVSSDLLFHVRMVEAGLAAAFLPDMVVCEADNSITPSPDLPVGRRSIVFHSRTGAERHPALTAVRDSVETTLFELHQ